MIAPQTYLNQELLPYPFCPGCGHGAILDNLDGALGKLELDPHRVVIVTDIGCQGLSDKYFVTNAFHGLHGRSVTYATGIKLVDPELQVVVLMGDGGCGIGGHHLLNAARRNIGLTVLVFNNFNYGMTGGEHSATTPSGAITNTTRYGQLERPLDICETVRVNGAGFVARSTAFEPDLSETIAAAIAHQGFALIDIWELCTAYFAPHNRLSKKALYDQLEAHGFPTGIIHRDEHPEYSRAYRAATADQHGQPTMSATTIDASHDNAVTTPQRWIIAGAAGKKIVSAATAFCQGAMRAGLWATQRNEYPVTVKTGFSLSEVILSREEIRYTGIERPDVMVVLFPEGLRHEAERLAGLDQRTTLYINAELLPVETGARLVPLTLSGRKEGWALQALAAILAQTGLYPVAALREAVSEGKYAAPNLAAIEAGAGLLA